MTIYTKRGDKGKTSLYDKKSAQKKEISKDSFIIQVLGSLDELNSSMGVAVGFCENKKRERQLKKVQKDILVISSIIAGSNLRFTVAKTKRLEKEINILEEKLPVLKNFVVPGGTKFASHLHFCRSMARKAERVIVPLLEKKEIKPQILMYLNRLSDFLFMLAREDNHTNKVSSAVWKKKEK